MKKNILPLAIIFTFLAAPSGPGQEPRDLFEGDDHPDEEIRRALRLAQEEGVREYHRQMKLAICVMDEDGEPLEGIDIDVGIRSLLHIDDHNNFRGKSDAHGLFAVQGGGLGWASVLVESEGYYSKSFTIEFKEKTDERYLPWDETTDITLYQVENPIPLRTWREVGTPGVDGWLEIPKLDEEVGYDILLGDWVEPHGKGETADLLFNATIHARRADGSDAWLGAVVRTANPDDGFVEHADNPRPLGMVLPRTAPAGPYDLKQIEVERKSGTFVRDEPIPRILPDPRTLEERKKYPWGLFFRIRTQRSEETGEITSAYYGFINRHGADGTRPPIEVAGITRRDEQGRRLPYSDELQAEFSVYLNPTPGDRNLEWNRQNLRVQEREIERIRQRDRAIEELRRKREQEGQQQDGKQQEGQGQRQQ